MITALRRAAVICKPSASLECDLLTIYHVRENELQFAFTNFDLQVQFSINAEEIEVKNADENLFSVNPATLLGILETIGDENIVLDATLTHLSIKGDISGNVSRFDVVLKPGYYNKDNKLILSEIESGSLNHISFDEVRFKKAIDTLQECPVAAGKEFSDCILFYKDASGSTNLFSTSGSVVLHYSFPESAYEWDDSIAIQRKNVIYIAGLCDCNTLDVYNSSHRAYFKIKDTIINDGYDIVVVSKKVETSIPKIGKMIDPKETRFYINALSLTNMLNKASLICGNGAPGIDLNIENDKLSVYAQCQGNEYQESFNIGPITPSASCLFSVNHRLVSLAIKKQKCLKFKIEISPGVMLITTDERDFVAVIAGLRK